MAIKADKDGFLIGEPIEVDTNKAERQLKLLESMDSRLDVIARALMGGAVVKRGARVSQPANSTVSRPNAGSSVSTGVSRAREAVEARQPRVASSTPARAKHGEGAVKAVPVVSAQAATPVRGKNGRFLPKGGADGSGSSDPAERTRERGAASAIASAVRDGLKGSGAQSLQGMDQVDPALGAIREVADLAAPITGLAGGALSGLKNRSERRKEERQAKIEAKANLKENLPWYKRLLKASKASAPVAQGGSGGGGIPLRMMAMMVGAGAAMLPVIGAALVAAIPLLLTGAAGMIAGGIGWKIGGWISDKWGTQISDAVWDSSEWIKEKWGGAADSISGWFGSLIDKIPGGESIRAAASGAKNWLAEKAGAAANAVGLGKSNSPVDNSVGNSGTGGGYVPSGKRKGGKGPSNVKAFVEQHTPLAEKVAAKLGVPTEAVLGQWGLETGWGKSVIPGTNNLGNIKDFSGKGPKAKDNMNGSVDSYRAYGSTDDFGEDFTKLLNNKRYTKVKGARTPEEYFTALKRAGYAEDPAYIRSGTTAAAMAKRAMGEPVAEAPKSAPPKPAAAPAPSLLSPAASKSSAPAATDLQTPAPPSLLTPIGSSKQGQVAVEVTMPETIGQNMSDRGIAHLATGGIGLGGSYGSNR